MPRLRPTLTVLWVVGSVVVVVVLIVMGERNLFRVRMLLQVHLGVSSMIN